MHLKSPFDALYQAAKVAKETLIVSEGSFPSPDPIAAYIGTPETAYNWWHASTGLYKRWLDLLGFDLTKQECNSYPCQTKDLKRRDRRLDFRRQP